MGNSCSDCIGAHPNVSIPTARPGMGPTIQQEETASPGHSTSPPQQIERQEGNGVSQFSHEPSNIPRTV